MNPPDAKIYTVTEITREIKALLDGRFRGVWVQGEVSNVRRPGSGHLYFTLKDEGSQLQAVIYRAQAARLRFELRDGMQAVAFGDVSVYAKGGRYQIAVGEIEPRGIGALQLALEQLKARLEAEGLFDRARKKPIPMLPDRIGIVTSPTGAAIRDILNVLGRRFADVRVLIDPVRVQGETAPAEIAAALDAFNARADVDVIIVARGGGSIEDLHAFNEETVARAIARSRIPVISAVGHEIDFTVSDFVADLRVPTPSAAAELVVAGKAELRGRLEAAGSRIAAAARRILAELKGRLARCERSYALRAPAALVRQHQQQVDELEGRLGRALRHLLEIARGRLGALAGKIESLSPLEILGRGYSVILREADGAVVTSAAQLRHGDMVRARLRSGGFTARVRAIEGGEPPGGAREGNS
ncbi:MAG: exodeoxyribonuclease VII large subunit [bacterium]|nr:exodeoxyribonuclease VII large subunit [bacterium]